MALQASKEFMIKKNYLAKQQRGVTVFTFSQIPFSTPGLCTSILFFTFAMIMFITF